MKLEKIKIKNFRNYDCQELEFSDRVNILIGENGQGKTNLLEAIYILSTGKSFKTARFAEMIKFEEDYFRVEGSFDEDKSVAIAVNRNKKKRVKINGNLIKKNSEMMENFYSIIFSPEDLSIIKDAPKLRRSFLDREICQLDKIYFENLILYNRALRQRNAILKEQGGELLLEAFDQELVKYGEKVIRRRREHIKDAAPFFCEIYRQMCQGREEANIYYSPNVEEDDFLSTIVAKRENEFRIKTSLVGPHRDDLKIQINGRDGRTYGSQGQQRSAALALKLASIKMIEKIKGLTPVLLLDDVLSELDRGRQEYLLSATEDIQTFLTMTNGHEHVIDRFPRNSKYTIAGGRVEKNH